MKKYKSKKLKREANQFLIKNPAGTKMIKRALKHNLDGTKQNTLITKAFNQIKKDKQGR